MMEDRHEDQGLGQDFNVNLVLENVKGEIQNVKTIIININNIYLTLQSLSKCISSYTAVFNPRFGLTRCFSMVWPSWPVLASYTPYIGSSSSLSTECGRWINLKRFKMIILIFAAGGRWLASSCQWPHEGRTGEMIRNHCGHHWSNHLDHIHI